MNERNTDDGLREMFAHVEPRPDPPPEARDRAFAAIEQEWESVTSARRRRAQRRWLAVAAALVAGVSGTWIGLEVRTPQSPQAWLVQGDVAIGASSAPVSADPVTPLSLDPQAEIVSRTASRWVSERGVDVRLAPNSRVWWVRPDEIDLLEGTVYVATDGADRFAVDTRFGRVVDIGTRYQVRADEQGVEVAVREGRVRLTSRHGEVLSDDMDEGAAAILSADADGVSGSTEPGAAGRWAWIHDAPAGYASDEPLVLLREIARDLGKRLQFTSAGVQASLASERVDGDFSGMAPLQALQILGAATNIDWRDEGDAIVVGLRE